MTDVTIRPFEPSDAPWVIAAHGAHYAAHDGFDASFQTLVAEITAEFVAHHDPAFERGWIAERGGAPLGCIFCVRLDDCTAKLRMFLVQDAVRGTGLGLRLLNTCMAFAKSSGYAQMQLWTHESHRAACALYRRNGWELRSSRPVHAFGCDLVAQNWRIALS